MPLSLPKIQRPDFRLHSVLQQHLDNLTKPPRSLGRLEEFAREFGLMRGSMDLNLRKRVIFTFAKKKLTLQARGAESGRSKVEMPVEHDGKTIEISFDPKFLVDMLRVFEPDSPLVLEVTDSATPAVFRHEPNYLYVVVPLVAAATVAKE